ncbi:mechanosensitive ion channel family protein [Geomesophilobacter sediminis]|uniref:Mechanosensitive ion channel n=1 Tax=Geomesophilobacter sediminis TaxID=2798584 RepID=A0A8J7J0R2_9BACT|nr:mechanosensitive ion channel domain-containing protein [Geomesophilobacter sediminis]MBJ6726227.1 mechanosensitive ion channel [Geomesophilobacter sediminis]
MDRLLYYLELGEEDGFLLFWSKEIIVATAIILLCYALSQVLGRALLRIAGRLNASRAFDSRMLERSTPPIQFLVNCTGWYLAISRLHIPEKLHLVASGALFVAIVVVLTNIAYRIADEALLRYGARVAGEEMSRQLMPLVQKLVSIFLIGTALIITLKHFNYDILSLVTALGVGSLAIGLAAKDTLANMVSGFTLMLDRPFRIGDVIELGNKSGEVIDIGLRSTKIKGADSTYLIIPNSELCNTTLVNMALPDSRVKVKVPLGVAYGTDVAAAKELLVQTALAVPGVVAEPGPEVYFTNFGESALNLNLFFWVADYRQQAVVVDRINSAIAGAFITHGIIMPFPTRTVFIEKDANHAPQD